jgi:hypothetical protein
MEVEGQLGLTGMLQEREGTGENANIWVGVNQKKIGYKLVSLPSWSSVTRRWVGGDAEVPENAYDFKPFTFTKRTGCLGIMIRFP